MLRKEQLGDGQLQLETPVRVTDHMQFINDHTAQLSCNDM